MFTKYLKMKSICDNFGWSMLRLELNDEITEINFGAISLKPLHMFDGFFVANLRRFERTRSTLTE